MAGKAMILAPVPVLGVTVGASGEVPDIGLRAGGQGCRQARVLAALDVPAVLCGCFGGQAGPLLRRLLAGEGLGCEAVERPGRNGIRIRDRRYGRVRTVAESPGDPLTPRDADRLCEAALAAGAQAAICVLSPAPGPVPADLYRRVAHGLRAKGRLVVADLTGEALAAALAGGVDVLRIDHGELAGAGRAEVGDLVTAMRRLRARGAGTIVVSRGDLPALAMIGEEVTAVPPPGPCAAAPASGDAVTAAIAAGLATGLQPEDAVRLGVAAGALQGVGPDGFDPRAARRIAERVELHEPAAEGVAGGSGTFW